MYNNTKDNYNRRSYEHITFKVKQKFHSQED